MRKRLPTTAALPLLLAGLLPALLIFTGCSFEIDYDRYAVAYGVNDYPGAAYDSLSAKNDAIDMSALLSSQGYSVTTRTDAAAVKAQLLADMAAAAAAVTEDDLFLFYFAGHGSFALLNGEEPSTADSFDEAIVLSDGSSEDYLFDDELADLLAAIPCWKKVVILDACYTGGFIGSELESDGIPPEYVGDEDGWLANLGDAISLYINFDDMVFDIPPDLALVIAAAGEQEASVYIVDDHAIMTTFLLETPEHGDRNGDGYVTVTEAYDYVRTRIEEWWNPYYDPASGLTEWEWIFSPRVSGGPLDYLLFEAR